MLVQLPEELGVARPGCRLLYFIVAPRHSLAYGKGCVAIIDFAPGISAASERSGNSVEVVFDVSSYGGDDMLASKHRIGFVWKNEKDIAETAVVGKNTNTSQRVSKGNILSLSITGIDMGAEGGFFLTDS